MKTASIEQWPEIPTTVLEPKFRKQRVDFVSMNNEILVCSINNNILIQSAENLIQRRRLNAQQVNGLAVHLHSNKIAVHLHPSKILIIELDPYYTEKITQFQERFNQILWDIITDNKLYIDIQPQILKYDYRNEVQQKFYIGKKKSWKVEQGFILVQTQGEIQFYVQETFQLMKRIYVSRDVEGYVLINSALICIWQRGKLWFKNTQTQEDFFSIPLNPNLSESFLNKKKIFYHQIADLLLVLSERILSIFHLQNGLPKRVSNLQLPPQSDQFTVGFKPNTFSHQSLLKGNSKLIIGAFPDFSIYQIPYNQFLFSSQSYSSKKESVQQLFFQKSLQELKQQLLQYIHQAVQQSIQTSLQQFLSKFETDMMENFKQNFTTHFEFYKNSLIQPSQRSKQEILFQILQGNQSIELHNPESLIDFQTPTQTVISIIRLALSFLSTIDTSSWIQHSLTFLNLQQQSALITQIIIHQDPNLEKAKKNIIERLSNLR